MNNDPQPITPIGRDCDCGYPLVQLNGTVTCAVYGRHGRGTAPRENVMRRVSRHDEERWAS